MFSGYSFESLRDLKITGTYTAAGGVLTLRVNNASGVKMNKVKLVYTAKYTSEYIKLGNDEYYNVKVIEAQKAKEEARRKKLEEEAAALNAKIDAAEKKYDTALSFKKNSEISDVVVAVIPNGKGVIDDNVRETLQELLANSSVDDVNCHFYCLKKESPNDSYSYDKKYNVYSNNTDTNIIFDLKNDGLQIGYANKKAASEDTAVIKQKVLLSKYVKEIIVVEPLMAERNPDKNTVLMEYNIIYNRPSGDKPNKKEQKRITVSGNGDDAQCVRKNVEELNKEMRFLECNSAKIRAAELARIKAEIEGFENAKKMFNPATDIMCIFEGPGRVISNSSFLNDIDEMYVNDKKVEKTSKVSDRRGEYVVIFRSSNLKDLRKGVFNGLDGEGGTAKLVEIRFPSGLKKIGAKNGANCSYCADIYLYGDKCPKGPSLLGGYIFSELVMDKTTLKEDKSASAHTRVGRLATKKQIHANASMAASLNKISSNISWSNLLSECGFKIVNM